MSPVECGLIKTVQYHFSNLPYPETDCTGKTVIVTGASGGLGLEAARHFVRLNGEKVILGCRSIEEGNQAKADIEKSTKKVGTNVIAVWQVDLGSFDSVKKFCDHANNLQRLDIVIENAAVGVATYNQLEGYEESITVNVLSTFLMALLLLPALRRSATQFNITPHLVFVSSDAHYFTSLPQRNSPRIFDELRGSKDMHTRYYVSKLLMILIARELARTVDESVPKKPHVIINTLNPGFCNTQIIRHAPWPVYWVLFVVARLIARTAEMGSRAIMTAAFAGGETHGKYMCDCRLNDGSSFVQSEEGRRVGKRAHDELLAILEAGSPGISNNI